MNARPQPVPSRRVVLTSASAITVRPVRWLWDERIALGTLALLGGREGIGKSLIAYTLSAQLTRGTLPGITAGKPRDVIVAASEDSWEHTIVPRLMAAGADLDRIRRLNVVTRDGSETTLSLPIDLAELKRVIENTQAALIVMDPLLSRLQSKLDSHKDADVRTALEPVVSLADASGACVLGIIHVNKSPSADPLTMLMGSRAFAAVARSVLFAMLDPQDPTKRLLGQAKNNLGRMDLPTLAFSISGQKVASTEEGDVWTGRVDWLADSAQSLTDAIAMSSAGQDEATAVADASEWLSDYIESADGSADSAKVKQAGARAGHATRTLHRARERLNLIVKPQGFPRRTFWELPPTNGYHPEGADSDDFIV
jgi:hypothetical protein